MILTGNYASQMTDFDDSYVSQMTTNLIHNSAVKWLHSSLINVCQMNDLD